MNALALSQQDLAARLDGSPALARQEYYNALRDALYSELMQDGRSEWLEALLADLDSGALTDIYLLDFAALMACHALIVRGQPLRDTSLYVPYARSAKGGKLAWSEMRPAGHYRMQIPAEMRGNLLALRRAGQQLPDGDEDDVAPPPERIAQRKFEQAQLLNRHLEKQNADLIAERDDLRRQLTELQEGYITEQLHYALEARRRQMEADLEQEFAREREAASDAFRRQYARELQHLEMCRFEADRSASALLDSVKEEYRTIRADMQSQLERLQQHFARQTQSWSASLFRQEARLLASSYVSLHELNVHGVLDLLLDAQEQASPLLPALKQHQQALHGQLVQMEQAMLRLGLQVEQPAPGTAFDPDRHSLSGPAMGGMVPEGASILACVKPGVLLLREAGLPAEALVRAEVTLASGR